MRNLGRALLVVGVLVLALLAGVLIGRNQRAEPTSEGNSTVQITTAPAPAPPPPAPLPAPVQAPPTAAIPRLAPDLQVQEDAAAVGMTTRDEAPAEDLAPAPKSAETDPSAQPPG